jgi:hypothetical protein
MKNEKVTKKEMKEVKGGFNPEFSVKDSSEVGVQMFLAYVCEPGHGGGGQFTIFDHGNGN